MRRPQAPFMEYGFYFHNMRGYDAYKFFIISLIEKMNAIPYSIIYREKVSRENLIEKDFGNSKIIDIELQVSNQETLVDLMNDTSKRISRVVFKKCTDTVLGVYEYAVITPASVEFTENDSRCVAILVEGEAFSIIGGETSRKRKKIATQKQKKIAAKALKCFKLLVDSLTPSYAAITFEYGLETPEKLKLDSNSYGFFDFYLSNKHFSFESIRHLQNSCPECFFETLSKGSLIISSPFFRNDKNDFPDDHSRYDLSKNVANLISRVLK